MYGNNNNRQSNRSSAAATKFKTKIAMDGSLDSACDSRKDNNPLLNEESCVEDVTSGVKNFKMILNELDDNDDFKKGRQLCDKHQKDDGKDHDLSITPFDICPKRAGSVPKLKPPLHAINKEKRNPKQRFHWMDHWMALLIVKRTNIHYLLKGLFYFLFFIFFIFYFFYFYFFVEETCVENVASGVNNFKMILKSLDDDDDFKKGKLLCDKHQKDDGKDHGSSITPFDIIDMLRPGMVLLKNYISIDDQIALDGSLDGASNSLKDNYPLLVEESCVEDVTFGVKNFKMILNELDDDDFKKGKLLCDKHQKDDVKDHGSSITPFDICPKRVGSVTKLKPSLHAMNKEKRNQAKRGKSIDMLRPGMVLLKNYISIDDQISIVKTCSDLGVGDGGFYQPGYRSGTELHLKMMCLGKNWDPESNLYSDTRPIDKAKPPGIPDMFHDMVKKAIQDSNAHIKNVNPTASAREIVPSMSPDLCIVNFYSKNGKLGLHQDKDESEKSLKKGLPVVSFSIGDAAKFLYGDTRDIDKADKVILESGDVLIFGGKSRLVFHGVTSILPNSAPTSLLEATDMRPGRLNLTFRQY